MMIMSIFARGCTDFDHRRQRFSQRYLSRAAAPGDGLFRFQENGSSNPGPRLTLYSLSSVSNLKTMLRALNR
jgi:hypothetical protein